MLGLHEIFNYHQCIDCGHAHLSPAPENMNKYYNTGEYYSFRNKSGLAETGVKNIRRFFQQRLLSLNIKKSFLFSSALKSLLSIKGLGKHASILDYGCGAGHFVHELKSIGFSNASGFDPYLPGSTSENEEIYLTNDLNTLKNACWDIITLNHVFEHLERPVAVLQALSELLCLQGKLLLRFPIIDSFAFEKYKENWVQFDAPRHLNLFTRKSIRLAVEKSGKYKIVDMYDDSYHFQFTGSELYLKKLTLNPKNNSRLKRLLSFKTYQYHFLAKKLNKEKRGDQMVIILERI